MLMTEAVKHYVNDEYSWGPIKTNIPYVFNLH